MTSPGARYSAGTAFLDVVPSFKGVQNAIKREVQQMERALGKEAGEEFGKEFEKGAVKAVDKALGTTKASAKKTGKEAAEEYAGQFATRFQDTVRKMQREMGSFKFDTQFDDKKLQNQFNAVRRDIEDLSKRKIGIDMDAGPAMIELDRIDARVRSLQDASIDLAVRDNLGAVAGKIEAFRKETQRQAALEVEVELEVERSLGLFEKTVRRRIEAAISHFPPIEFDADVTPAQDELMRLRQRMIELGDKRIGVDIDGSAAMAELEALRRELATLANDKNIDVQVRTDAAAAAKELLAIRVLAELVDKTKVDIEVKLDSDSFFARMHRLRDQLSGVDADGRDAANGFRAFNAVVLAGAALIPGIIPGLTALAGGLVLLGPLALGAAAGLGVMAIGFSGVGDAVKAMGKVQDNAAKDAEAYAKKVQSASRTVEDAQLSLQRAEESGARQISDANRAVSDARENAARVAEQAAERVADAIEGQQDAEEDLVRAQDDVVRAQEAVTQAREDAQDRIEDLRLSIIGGALAEREAVLDLAEAQREYEASLSDPEATAEDRERLLIDLEQQRLRVEQLGIQNGRLAEEQAEVARTGVEGSREVVAAQDGVRSAQDRVADAQERVRDAVENVASAVEEGQRAQADASRQITDAVAAQQQAQTDAARMVSDAQRNLTQAQEDYTAALGETSTSAEALEVAMGKLGPAGREFAEFWFALLPQFRELRDIVQAGMFPGLQDAITNILQTNGPLLRQFMGDMATTLGDMFRQFGDMMTSPQWLGIWRTFSEYAPIFMQQFGEVGMAMLTFFGELFQALAPYSERFGDALVRITESWAEWMESFGESQTFKDIMEWLFTNGPVIAEHFWSILEAAGALVVALEPLGLLILGIVGNIADWIAAMDPDLLGIIVTTILGLVIAFQLAAGALALVAGAFAILVTPLALAIFLFGALVTGLVIAYTQSETFRDIVDAVFRAVGAVISWVWENVILPVLGFFANNWRLLAEGISWIWENVLKPTWDAIVAVVTFMWEDVLQPIFGFIAAAWQVLVDAFNWYWENILQPVFDAWMAVAKIAFAFLTVVIFGPLALAWKLLSEGFRWVYDNILKPIWDAWSENLSWLWENVIQPIFGWIGDLWDSLSGWMGDVYRDHIAPIFDWFAEKGDWLGDRFQDAVDLIGRIWDGLRTQLAKPINFVIETILNKGLFGAFNWIIDTLSLPTGWKIKDFAPVSVNGEIPRFAVGGKVPGYSPNDTADNIPAMLTAGEYVLPVGATRRLRQRFGDDFLESLRQGLPGYAEGGPVYQQIFASVKKKFPRARMNSGLRSTNDLHGAGLAVDLGEEGFAGGRGRPYLAAMANTLYRTAKPFIAELIYTGAGDQTPDVKNGRDLNYGAATNAAHMNHVHLAVRNLAGFLQAFGSGALIKGQMMLESPWDSITGAFNSLKDAVTGPVRELVGKLGDSALGKILGGMPGKAVDWAWGKVKGSVADFLNMFDQSNGGDNAAVDQVIASGNVQNVVKSVAARYGWDRGGEWNALATLIQKESSWNPRAQNPTSTAYGLFQFLNATWGGYGVSKTSDPAGQAQAGLRYIMDRYGSPSKALAFHNRNNWYSEGGEVGGKDAEAPTLYDTGGWLPPGITTVLNATNKPEPILTGQQWDDLVGSRRSNDYDGGARGIRDLHLHEVNADLEEAIGAVNHWARVYSRGGRYAEVGTGN